MRGGVFMSGFLPTKKIDVLLKQKFGSDYKGFGSLEYEQVLNYLATLSVSDTNRILSGAVVFSELNARTIADITLNDVIKVLTNIDRDVLLQYGKAIETIRTLKLGHKAESKMAHEIFATIKPKQEQTNEMLYKIANGFVDKTSKVAKTFSNLAPEDRKDLVSEIYSNCVGRMKMFWQRIEANNFTEIIDTLMNAFGEDSLTEEEVIELSKKCATIFCDSSREKIKGVEEVLTDYKNFVLEQIAKNANMFSKEKDFLDNYKFVNVLRQAASISKFTKNQLLEVENLLKGQSIGQIYADALNDDNSKHHDLISKFKDVNIELSVKEMIWVLAKNPSIFGQSITNDLQVVEQVQNALLSNYGEKMKDFNAGDLFTKENFLKGFPSLDNGENILANITTLSGFVSGDELTSYLKKDMRILGIDKEVLRQAVIKALKNAKTKEDISVSINQIFKNVGMLVEESKDKKQKTSTEAKTESESKADSTQNFKLTMDDLKDVLVDLDFIKLREILGSYFDEFVEKLFPQEVDRIKIGTVISSDKQHSLMTAQNEASGALYPNHVSVDVDKFSKFAYDKSEMDYISPITLLIETNLKLDSAIKMFGAYKGGANQDADIDKLFAYSSTYFSLAKEKDDVLQFAKAHFNPKTASEHKRLCGLIESKFAELSDKYSKIVKAKQDVLDTYIANLLCQEAQLEKEISEAKFQNVEEFEIISPQEGWKQVKEFWEQKAEFDARLLQIEEEKKATRRKIIEERNRLLDDSHSKKVAPGEQYALFDRELTQTEKELDLQLARLNADTRKVLLDIRKIEQNVLSLERKLFEASKRLRYKHGLEVCMQKLQAIKDKIACAKRIKLAGEPDTSGEQAK